MGISTLCSGLAATCHWISDGILPEQTLCSFPCHPPFACFAIERVGDVASFGTKFKLMGNSDYSGVKILSESLAVSWLLRSTCCFSESSNLVAVRRPCSFFRLSTLYVPPSSSLVSVADIGYLSAKK